MTAEVTRLIDAHRERLGFEPICRELQVARSTYYGARRRRPSARRVRDLRDRLVPVGPFDGARDCRGRGHRHPPRAGE